MDDVFKNANRKNANREREKRTDLIGQPAKQGEAIHHSGVVPS